MSGPIGDRIVHDLSTGDAVIPGPRGETLRFTKNAVKPGEAVAYTQSAAAVAIPVKEGLAYIDFSGTHPLPAVVAGTDDGKELVILSGSGGVVVTASYKSGFTQVTLITGQVLTVRAYNAEWYIVSTTGTPA